MTRPTRVHLHIDRLVLGGIPAANRAQFAEGLRTEIARQLTDGPAAGGLAGMPHAARLDVPVVRMASGISPGQAGKRVARGIARRFSR